MMLIRVDGPHTCVWQKEARFILGLKGTDMASSLEKLSRFWDAKFVQLAHASF